MCVCVECNYHKEVAWETCGYHSNEGNAVGLGDLWALQKRQGMVLCEQTVEKEYGGYFGETCGSHLIKPSLPCMCGDEHNCCYPC